MIWKALPNGRWLVQDMQLSSQAHTAEVQVVFCAWRFAVRLASMCPSTGSRVSQPPVSQEGKMLSGHIVRLTGVIFLFARLALDC
mmetsp:Transcript_122642/g.291674  ORF Transcript_122642/g.291674 Transcript_122642/m.291674 type:complete len:85 (+) Transcript_122642:444-698(+)